MITVKTSAGLIACLKQTDKQLHFLVGAVIALACGYFIHPIGAVLVAALIGAIKEIYDHYHPNHTVDVLDFLATAAGGLAGGSVILIQQLV